MNFDLQLQDDVETPLYRQIYSQLRELILDGSLPARTKLPPTREMAALNDVARTTVTQAYGQLEAEGYVTARRGAGTFVADALPLVDDVDDFFGPDFAPWGQRVIQAGGGQDVSANRSQLEIDFGFGRSFPHIFPYHVWRRLLGRYLSTDDVMLSRYGSIAGFHPLREAIADYLATLRGVHCNPEQIVIVSGAQQALDILTRLLLQPGDEVLVETPGYTDAFAVFRLNGAQLTAVPVDDEGLPPHQIPADCHARLAFVTPTNQFPRGGAMPLERRLSLLQWARHEDAIIVEDDYDGALRYEGQPLAALQGLDDDGRVVYLGTFSKVLFPALRLGYVVLPPSLQSPFVRAKGITDRGAPTLTQAAVADFIREGHFERHLRHLRKEYGRRREALVTALDRHFGDRVQYAPEPAGLHVMVYLDPALHEEKVVHCAAAAGVGIYPGATYHLQPAPPPSILLGFSGLTAAEIEEGIRRLALFACG